MTIVVSRGHALSTGVLCEPSTPVRARRARTVCGGLHAAATASRACDRKRVDHEAQSARAPSAASQGRFADPGPDPETRGGGTSSRSLLPAPAEGLALRYFSNEFAFLFFFFFLADASLALRGSAESLLPGALPDSLLREAGTRLPLGVSVRPTRQCGPRRQRRPTSVGSAAGRGGRRAPGFACISFALTRPGVVATATMLVWQTRGRRLGAGPPEVTRLFRDERRRELGQSDPRPRPSLPPRPSRPPPPARACSGAWGLAFCTSKSPSKAGLRDDG